MRWLRSAALVDAWFDNLRPEQLATARALHALILAEAPSLTQGVRWGNLVFLHRDAHALAIVTHKEQAHLQVFHGAALPAGRFPMLEGQGKTIRHVKLRYSQPLDEAALRPLIRAAIDLMDRM